MSYDDNVREQFYYAVESHLWAWNVGIRFGTVEVGDVLTWKSTEAAGLSCRQMIPWPLKSRVCRSGRWFSRVMRSQQVATLP